MKANTVRIVVEFEPELKQALRKLAKRRGQTMKGAIKLMIQRELANDIKNGGIA